ncbi:MAG TPA: M10 family metallopeptidase [Methyloceanibacter sp.]|jgi:serralysin
MANGILANPSGYQDIDGVLWGWCWQINQPNNHTLLTYSFPTSTASYLGYTAVNGFEAFNAKQQVAAIKVLRMVDNVSNVDFQYTADPTQANIRMAEMTSIDVGTGPVAFATAYGIAPDPNNAPAFAHGDTWFNHTSYNKPTLGSFAFASGIMHELGHALGLKHGHVPDDVLNANGQYAYSLPALSFDHDSLEYSVMTYRSYPGGDTDTVNAIEFPSTLMQDDILALQWLYGSNYDCNSGNTVYRFDPKTGAMSIDGKSQGATFHHKILLTIWDGGGNDTIDFSNYKSNAVIDLAPGAWSTPWQKQLADLDIANPGVHLARGCIANAQLFSGDDHGWIENGIGGRGNDSISGNAVSNALLGNAGNDYLAGLGGMDALVGGKGTDIIFGGADADVFVFKAVKESKAGAKHDTIADFSQFDDDLINLVRLDANSHKGGIQHFTFIGELGFSHKAGQLRFADHLLQGDVNGDGKVDFEVYFNADQIVADDLVLR